MIIPIFYFLNVLWVKPRHQITRWIPLALLGASVLIYFIRSFFHSRHQVVFHVWSSCVTCCAPESLPAKLVDTPVSLQHADTASGHFAIQSAASLPSVDGMNFGLDVYYCHEWTCNNLSCFQIAIMSRKGGRRSPHPARSGWRGVVSS